MSLAFALQTWGSNTGKGDIKSAIELCQLISDLEDHYRNDCYFMVVFKRGTPLDYANQCVLNLRDKFKADAFLGKNYAPGHPYGSNMLWASTMTEVQALAKNPKKFPYNG